jgi:hypothetical protein
MHTLISVADTGCGMDDDTMKRVFDPFFTTKEKTKGTGLGLATVHGIVTSLGGAVAVRSEKGKGSVFEVYLPVMDQVTEDVPADLPEMIPLGNGETVMVVDDEEPVVEITASMLEQLGYRVVTAASSDEALKRLRENPAGVDLVITDQTMPGNDRRRAGLGDARDQAGPEGGPHVRIQRVHGAGRRAGARDQGVHGENPSP